MKIETVADFRTLLSQGPYAWPGGYPLYFITHDGAALSFAAAAAEKARIEESIADRTDDGWLVEGIAINFEDQNLYCDHTGEKIESAYGEDDDEEPD